VYYNESKTVLSTVVDTTTTFKTPANTAFVRLSIKRDGMTNPQMELGSTATAYAPYIPSVDARLDAVESGLADTNSKLTSSTFNITANECFDIIFQGSHYITNKVAHICCLLKANSIPESSTITIAELPSGNTITQEGLIIPIYRADGRWTKFDTTAYGYVSNTLIKTNKADIVVDKYYLVDFVAHLN
jgi:hypothetical protein